MEVFFKTLDTDYLELRKKAKKMKDILDNGKEVRVKTAKGTDIIIDISEMVAIANDGDYSEPGKGGNMPCGEVYIPPNKK